MSTMSDENRVTPQESDEYDPPKAKDANRITSLESEDYDLTNPEPKHSKYWYDYNRNDPDAKNPFTDAFDYAMGEAVVSGAAADTINIDTSGFDLYGKDLDKNVVTFGVDTPTGVADTVEFTLPTNTAFLGDEEKPKPDLKFKSHKYQEDKGIADLKDYVSSTYKGHYTNNNSDTQTLDLIHSVGDAESFCRSNAIKYLSRYDKKGSAKQDILKAMHYCLLLYYFSGNTKEPDYTNTRYETF